MRSTASRARAATSGSTFTSVLHRLQRAQDLRQRDPLHVRAEVARPDELDVRVLDGDVVAHRALGDHHHPPRPGLADVADHRRRRAHEVGLGEHVGRALRVGEDLMHRPGAAAR